MRTAWIPEHPTLPLYRAAAPYQAAGSTWLVTTNANDAIQFVNREECERWCRDNPEPRFVAREHGWGGHEDADREWWRGMSVEELVRLVERERAGHRWLVGEMGRLFDALGAARSMSVAEVGARVAPLMAAVQDVATRFDRDTCQADVDALQEAWKRFVGLEGEEESAP